MSDEGIIERIIALEEQVSDITREARQNRQNLPERINARKVKIERYMKQEFESDLRKAAESAARESDAQIAGINANRAKREKAMDETYARFHAKWEDEIFRSVIGDQYLI